MRLLARLHLLAAAVPLLFLAVGIGKAIGAGFTPAPELYPRVRYKAGPAAEVVLNTWKSWKVEPAQRVVAVWGLADAGESRLTGASPGLAVALRLQEQGARLRASDPRFLEEAGSLLGGAAELCADPYEAAAGATDLLLNSDHELFRSADYPRLAELAPGAAIFDCIEAWDAEAARAAGLRPLPLGGEGWPPWLDPEYLAFVEEARSRVPEGDGILLLPSAPLRTPSPRARWYLLLNYALAPRRLYLPLPELASGTAPQYQQWVRECTALGRVPEAERRRLLQDSGARWILWFRHAADFQAQNWRLEEIAPP